MTLTLTGAEHSRAHQAGACVRETRGPLAPWVCGLTLPAGPETRAALCLWGSTHAPPRPPPHSWPSEWPLLGGQTQPCLSVQSSCGPASSVGPDSPPCLTPF